MTFTWPADLPQKALWGTLPGQVASKTVHLAGKKSKNCLWNTCSGGTSGQVNVTRLFSSKHLHDSGLTLLRSTFSTLYPIALVTFIWTETCHSKVLWGIWGVPMERNCVHLHRLPASQLRRTLGWVCR